MRPFDLTAQQLRDLYFARKHQGGYFDSLDSRGTARHTGGRMCGKDVYFIVSDIVGEDMGRRFGVCKMNAWGNVRHVADGLLLRAEALKVLDRLDREFRDGRGKQERAPL